MHFGLHGLPPGSDRIHPEVALWAVRVAANGGTLTSNSLAIANRFMWQVENRTWKNKLLWIAPMLGANLAAARTPLRDWLGGGFMGNNGFADADFSERTGLQGNGTSKNLITGVYAIQLGRGLNTVNGGIGYWETSINTGGGTTVVMGNFDASETIRYCIDLRTTGLGAWMAWAYNGPATSIAAGNENFYAQRNSSTNRRFFRDGILAATDVNPDSAPTGAADRWMRLVGSYHTAGERFNAGRCGLAYMTDGTLTDDEAMDLHMTLKTYLKEPSGK